MIILPDAIISSQFIRFGVVGLVGLLIDTAIVYAMRQPLGLYGAGALAYLFAASGTWLLNRVWTFRSKASARRQWAMFMMTNSIGFVLNRGAYALLVTFVAVAAAQPIIATAGGSIAGMFINFGLSRRFVFEATS